MKKLKTTDLNRKTAEEYKASDKIPLVVVLENIRSMNNVGSFFRTCDAFLINKLYLCGITGKPPHREINKTALGSTETVEWEYYGDCVELLLILKSKGYKIVGCEQTSNSKPLNEITISETEKIALVFGNEVEGVSEEVLRIADYSTEIPQFGTKHSLNVSVAGGIIIYRFFELMNANKKGA